MHNDDALMETIDAAYRPTLKSLDVSHPKLIILFSGPPSSGKSRIARALEEHFRAVRLEADAIRIILGDLYPDMSLDEKSQIAYRYLGGLCAELAKTSANGLWVIDSSTDRTYDAWMNFTREHGFDAFLIEMRIPEDVHRQWIIAGGDRPFSSAAGYLEKMAFRRQQQRDFLRNHTPDLVVEPGYSMQTIYDAVERRLKVR